MQAINDFYKAYYSDMQEFFLEFEAKKFGLTKDNYWEKVLKQSTISEEDFEKIENRLGYSLPLSFKVFYQAHYSLENYLDTGGLLIVGNMENTNLSSLYDYIFEHPISNEFAALKLVPFGMYNDEWYICLDMNSNPNDPRIVLFEMSNWHAGKEAISHRAWFSNFTSFLSCIADYQREGNWNNFDKLDPDNNYLTAYDYWKK